MTADSARGHKAAPGRSAPDNDEIAGQLERVAELLRLQDANPFRVRSYERAAQTLGINSDEARSDRQAS